MACQAGAGCFQPPSGGTVAIVPSRIFKRACWTPSRMILVASPARLDLVDLVDVDDALLGDTEVAVGCLDQPGEQDSTSSPTYPASVRAGRITDGEGDIEVGSQGFDQVGLPAAAGTDQAGCWTSRFAHCAGQGR